MGQRTQREVVLQFTTAFCNEIGPHQPSSGVVREWKVNWFIKELLEFFLPALLRIRRASYNCDPCRIIYELSSPFTESLLDSGWVICSHFLIFLSTLSLLFLFHSPHQFSLVNVNYGRLVLFGCQHYRGDQLLFLFLGRELFCDVVWAQVKEDRVCLCDAGSNNHSLSSTRRSIE